MTELEKRVKNMAAPDNSLKLPTKAVRAITAADRSRFLQALAPKIEANRICRQQTSKLVKEDNNLYR